MIGIFTGAGKGKTTAALGTALRGALDGRKVIIVQFLKGGGYTGELAAIDALPLALSIRQFGFGCHRAELIRSGAEKCSKCGRCFKQNRNPAFRFAELAWEFACGAVLDADLVVLDEISHAVNRKLLVEAVVVEWLTGVKADVVMTGRNMPESFIALADFVTECKPLCHPMENGIDARRGMEY